MNIVIPLGGVGKRFSELGYKDPKPLIKVLGKEIILWVLESIKTNTKDIIYIVYNNNLEYYNFRNFFVNFPKINFLRLNSQTHGAVETIYELTRIIEKSSNDNKLLILDGDTFYKKNIIKKIDKKFNTIFYHKTKIKEPIFSYIKIKNKKVIEIKEKIKISNNANTGAYYFNSLKNFNSLAKLILKTNKKAYVSDIYKKILEQNKIIKSEFIKNDEFVCLGTPKQVIDFCKNTKSKVQRFCFDLDNTLVTFPKIKNDYSTVNPIEKNIKFLNFLKSKGHYIIIYTARRMRTHNGDIKKVKKEVETLTRLQLKKFKVQYDELIFGKPFANFYIDDLSINSFENLNVKLGFYEKKDHITRSFNEIIVGEKFTLKKSKKIKKLSAEVNYLNKIPNKLKSFFPKLIDHGKNWYKMDTINGTKFSYLLINNLLFKDDLNDLFQALLSFHKYPVQKNKINISIYDNYSKKLKQRSSSKNIETIGKKNYNKIYNFLNEYANKKEGRMGIIHGDPVFSNIIKEDNGDIKFLDPRGAQLEYKTIYGDINYDYAKIYQSLTGYENIIMEKNINLDNLKQLREHFEDLIITKTNIQDIKILRYITSSLYLSLLDFHDNKYHGKFIKIVKSLIV